ncbi:hypothetical protein M378DRAFT_812865 [Amanita muscaria Koide BX008]|uniref:Uncharacterized protein n=1 Tax=Amanita muscaria (strain Koide BX008) TaxID=946122 RepID=A0A0C2WJY7_AMAMK|nr:hypothetical protein M378DRAFT_812865 [Amanita muscaria Koide BX008]
MVSHDSNSTSPSLMLLRAHLSDSSMGLTIPSANVSESTSFEIVFFRLLWIASFSWLTSQSCPMVTGKTIDSPSMRQFNRREPSWLGTGVPSIVVRAESKVEGATWVFRRCEGVRRGALDVRLRGCVLYMTERIIYHEESAPIFSPLSGPDELPPFFSIY